MFHRCRCLAPCPLSSCRATSRGLNFRPMYPKSSCPLRFPGSNYPPRSRLSPFREPRPLGASFITVTDCVSAEPQSCTVNAGGRVPVIRDERVPRIDDVQVRVEPQQHPARAPLARRHRPAGGLSAPRPSHTTYRSGRCRCRTRVGAGPSSAQSQAVSWMG